MGNITFGIADNGNERGYMTIPVGPIDAGNFDAIADVRADIALEIAALSLGVLQTQSINIPQTLSNQKANDVWANRELAVRFVLQDAEGNKTTVSLPAPDLAKFPFNTMGSDIVNWPYAGTHADVTAFATTLEAAVHHPLLDSSMDIVRIELVGRSN